MDTSGGEDVHLYNITTNQEAIRQISRAMIDSIGNLEPAIKGSCGVFSLVTSVPLP